MKVKLHTATILALSAALFSGVNNFLTKQALTAVGNPLVFTTLKNVAVGVFLVGLLFIIKKWPEVRSLNKSQVLKLFFIGLFGGGLAFAFYFLGLAQTTAINASLIHKTLFLWVLLIAMPLLKEKISTWQWVGVAVIFAANVLVGGFTGFKYNTGELMILGATIIWAVENIIAKKVLHDVASSVVAAARMIIGAVPLILYIVWQGRGAGLISLNTMQWGWTLLTSALLLGYVLSWFTALKYAPVIYVATLLVPATLITNLLSSVFTTHNITSYQLISGVLFVLGTALIITFSKYTAGKTVEQTKVLSQDLKA